MSRPAVERGRMKHEDELIIQEYIIEIEMTIEAKDLTGPLFTRKIIDMDDMQKIEAGDTRPERAKRFLNTLLLRGPGSFDAFVESLNVMGYKDLSRKLTGSKSTTESMASCLVDAKETTYLSHEISQLQIRVSDVELSRAKNDDVGKLRDDVKEELQSLNSTLKKIEDLSRVSKETITTVNKLKSQLDEKERLLREAREQIKELEKKVESLEGKNANLRRSVQRQQREIANLQHDQWMDRQRMQKKMQEMEDDRKNDFEELQQMMKDDKKKMMSVVETLANNLAEAKKDKQNERGKPRFMGPPRNRFQKTNGKYN